MKSTFGVAIFISICFHVTAQTIPNSGFENWTMQPGGYEDPDYWGTMNYVPWISVYKTADSYSGNFALEVINNAPGLEGPTPGQAWTTYINTNILSKISAYVKCDSISGTGKGQIKVYGFLAGSGQAIGSWETAIEIPQFTLVEIPLSPLVQWDSIMIFLVGYAENAPNGTSTGFARLTVDDLTEEISSDVNEFNINSFFSLSPNPFSVSTDLYLSKELNNKSVIFVLHDVLGKEVKRQKWVNEKSTINGELLSNGIYSLGIILDDRYLYFGKLIKQ